MSDLYDPMNCSQPVALLSMEFTRQEYWSRLLFPSPGIFPTQGSILDLPHCRYILYHLSYQGSHVVWPSDVQSHFIGKDPGAGRDWGQEEEMVGWHYQLNGYEFEQTPGDSERHGTLVCCSP